MSNCMFGYPNYAKTATFSGGNWNGLAKLATEKSHEAAVSNTLLPTDTLFTVDLGADRRIRILSLYNTNLSSSATYRYTVTNSYGTLIYQTDWLLAWLTIYGSLDLNWEDPNFWAGSMAEDEFENVPQLTLNILEGIAFGRYIHTEIKDQNNPDGYVSIGKMIACPVWQPEFNAVYGAEVGVVDTSETIEMLNGEERIREKAILREAHVSFDFMSEDEGNLKAMAMTRRLGISGEVFFVFDPGNPKLLLSRSFCGRLRELNLLNYPNYSITGMPFIVREKP